MTKWTFKTQEQDGTTLYSSVMTKERAIEFACDLLLIGVRVVSLESSDGEVLDETEIARVCHGRRNGPSGPP